MQKLWHSLDAALPHRSFIFLLCLCLDTLSAGYSVLTHFDNWSLSKAVCTKWQEVQSLALHKSFHLSYIIQNQGKISTIIGHCIRVKTDIKGQCRVCHGRQPVNRSHRVVSGIIIVLIMLLRHLHSWGHKQQLEDSGYCPFCSALTFWSLLSCLFLKNHFICIWQCFLACFYCRTECC